MSHPLLYQPPRVQERTVRAALRVQFGKYRIRKGGRIEVWGLHAEGIGWYLFGWTNESATLERLGI